MSGRPGPGLSGESAFPDVLLRRLTAELSGKHGMDEGQVGGVLNKIYEAITTLHEPLINNNQQTKDEFNRIQADPTARASMPAVVANRVFATPAASADEARERLRGVSPAQMRAYGMHDMQAQISARQTHMEDVNWQVGRYARQHIGAEQIADVHADPTKALDVADHFKDHKDALARNSSTTESLTDIMRKMFEDGKIGQIAGGGAGAFRGVLSGALGDLSKAQPELAPFIQGGELAMKAYNAVDQNRTQLLTEQRSLSLGAGMDSRTMAETANPAAGELGVAEFVGLGPLAAIAHAAGMLKGPQDTSADLRNALADNAVKQGYDKAVGIQVGGQVGSMGVSGSQDIANASIGALAAATATGLDTHTTGRMMGTFMTQGGLNPEHAIDQFQDLVNTANDSGVGVAKLAQELVHLQDAGAGTRLEMASLAAVQQHVGQGVNAGQLLGPAMTATGTQAIQYAGMLGFKSTTDFVDAQIHPQRLMEHAEAFVQQHKSSFQGPQGQAALEAILPQMGLDISGMAVDKQANFAQQLIAGQLNSQQLESQYKTLHAQQETQRKDAGHWVDQQANLQKEMTPLVTEMQRFFGSLWDHATQGITGQGGGATTAAAAAHDAAVYATQHHGQARGAHLAHPPTHPTAHAAGQAAAHHPAQTPALVHPALSSAAGTAAAEVVTMDVRLAGTLQVHDERGRAIGTAMIQPQHTRLQHARLPKGHQSSPVGV